MTKRLWIVAGPNGAGKTTLVKRYNRDNLFVLNPDDIAVKISPSAPEKASLQAGREATYTRRKLLSEGQSFILETTFSGKGSLSIIQSAKEQGYKINLAFVGVKSPALSVSRIVSRVTEGGHFVPSSDVQRRYQRAGENLKKVVSIVDRVLIVDNSKSKHRFIARLEKGKIKKMSSRLPKWVKQQLPALSKAQNRGL